MLTNLVNENFRLKSEYIFEGLTQEEQAIFLASSVTHVYSKGEVIFRERGIPMGIYYIRSGVVKKYKSTVEGGEQIFFVCSSGELLGYHALLGDERYQDSAAALQQSEITFIPKEAFLSVLNTSPVLPNRLLKALGHEFTLFITTITNLATKTVRERLAYTLLVLEEKFKVTPTASEPVAIALSRTDLANMIGTAKETVVRLLKELKGRQVIKTTAKTITILDRKSLIGEANPIGKLRGDPENKK